MKSLNELLDVNNLLNPDRVGYRFISEDYSIETLTYKGLFGEVNKLANLMSEYVKPNDRIILAARPGIEYIIGFYACLRTGAIAVPVFPPGNTVLTTRLVHIIQNCKPKLMVVDAQTLKDLKKGLLATRFVPNPFQNYVGIDKSFQILARLLKENKIPMVSTEDRQKQPIELVNNYTRQGTDIAFLQYTSGSTGDPKGVILTHANLLHNMALIKNGLNHSESSHMFSWLPPYHDMGLIAGILEPLYAGIPSTLMSPVEFIKKPSRWLEHMSQFKCTTSGAPNFAFDLCTRKISDSMMDMLDLGHIEAIANGAEPISYQTIKNFHAKFKSAGLRDHAIFPCYGLAESTVMATASPVLKERKIIAVNSSHLANNIIRIEAKSSSNQFLVSSGIPQMVINIVNPDSHTICKENEVGEIWIHGESVAKGYYENIEESNNVFNNFIHEDVSQKVYLKTGDLGFLYEGELFVCGRLKDLIIINGQNYYPQDLESAVSLSNHLIRSGSVIAYSTKDAQSEQLIIVAGISKGIKPDAYNSIVQSIQKSLADQFHLYAREVFLVAAKTIPKTSSGKLQRKRCAQLVQERTIPILYHHNHQMVTAELMGGDNDSTPIIDLLQIILDAPSGSREHILSGHIRTIAASVLNPNEFLELDIDKGFFDFGFNSISAIEFKSRIEQSLKNKIKIDESLIFTYPTIRKVSRYILSELSLLERETITNNSVQIEANTETEIAIIGMSCTFPGASNLDSFWKLLEDGKEGIQEILPERFDVNDYYDPAPATPGKMVTRRAGCIEDIDKFDANFFSISPKEATYLDPQHRLLLNNTWSALEDAGISPKSLNETNTGVFVGISTHDYFNLMNKFNEVESINSYAATGNAASPASGRISYFLGLHGPSISIDTACSSSLVALNEACEHIKNGDCSIAIVGGVNALLSPDLFISFSSASMLSPDGKCKTFDEKADGYVRGEGCGVIILKRLSAALNDNDKILAVIKSSGVNQDGASTGLTVPNGQAQESLLTQVLLKSGLKANDVDYIECHGTGTRLGDPIEISALSKVYAKNRDTPLLVGSVKTNIGHLEAASGIAGLIKVILALNNKIIPSHLNFQTLNSSIQKNTSIRIANETISWPKMSKPRVAGISSFGFSGTNAHVIVEEAPTQKNRDKSVLMPQEYLFVLSAKSKLSLERLVILYRKYLSATEYSLADICYTAAIGRAHFNHRIALTTQSVENLVAQLSKLELMSHEMTLSDEVVLSDDLAILSSAYLAGKNINWSAYYAPYEAALRKVSLPTYCFDKQRYWIDIKKNKALNSGTVVHELLGARIPGSSKEIHFLNQLNTNDVDYLKSHQVFGKVIVPGAVFIESALASGQLLNEEIAIKLSDLRLLKPLQLESGKQYDFEVSLLPKGGGYEGHVDVESQEQLNWDKYATFRIDFAVGEQAQVIDLETLKQGKLMQDVNNVYKDFMRLGLDYGPAFQVIRAAYVGKREALVLVRMHDQVTPSGYYMHPTLLDGAFQAIGLLVGNKGITYIPSQVDSLTYYQPLGSSGWVLVHLLEEHAKALKADIFIYDEEGVALAKIEGFSARAIDKHNLLRLINENEVLECFIEGFNTYTLPAIAASEAAALFYGHADAMKAVELPPNWKQGDMHDWSAAHVVISYAGDLSALVSLAQRALKEPPLSMTLVLNQAFSVVETDSVEPEQRAALGFWRSFKQESGAFSCYLVDSDSLLKASSVMELISQNALPEPEIILRGDEIYVPRLCHKVGYFGEKTYQYREDASYLITGGTGGLGLELAKHLISNGAKQIVLTSRHAASDLLQSWIDNQRKAGIDITHYQADVANEQELAAVFKTINKGSYPLRGIFHAAGVLSDGLLMNLSQDDFSKVWAPKIIGSKNLDKLSRDEDLDCFVLFSSIVSVLGNSGQSNYAAANAFMDGLAQSRRQKGLPALSINWGPFATVGMAAHLEVQHKSLGIVPLEISSSFRMMDELLTSPVATIGVMQVDWSKAPKVTHTYLSQVMSAPLTQETTWTTLLEVTPQEKRHAVLVSKIKVALANVLGIQDILTVDDNQGFFEMGMDSIMAVELQNRLNRQLDRQVELKNSDLFEHATLNAITSHILSQWNAVKTSSAPSIQNLMTKNRPITQPQLLFYQMINKNTFDPTTKLNIGITFKKDLDNTELLNNLMLTLNQLPVFKRYFRLIGEQVEQFHQDDFIHEVAILHSEEAYNYCVDDIISSSTFNPDQLPLLKACFYDTNPARLFISVYHGILDGLGVINIINALEAHYQKSDQEKQSILESVNFPEQNAYLFSSQVDASYWLSQFKGFNQKLPVTWFAGKLSNNLHTKSHTKRFSRSDVNKLALIARQKNITLSNLILFALGTVLTRLNNSDSAVGVVFNNRKTKKEQQAADVFLNTLPLLFKSSASNLQVQLEHFKKALIDLFNHSEEHIVNVLKLLEPTALPHRPLLYDVLFNFIPKAVQREKNVIDEVIYFRDSAHSLLTLFATELTDGLQIDWYYRPGVLNEEMVELLHYKTMELIDALSGESELIQKKCPLQPKQIKTTDDSGLFNALLTPGPWYNSIEEQCSYDQLQGKVAALIKNNQLKSNTNTVVIDGHPSVWMYVSLLACILSKKTFLIVDPNWDRARREHFMAECSASLVLTPRAYEIDYAAYSMLMTDELAIENTPLIQIEESNSDWIMYTGFSSGSTGVPKRSEALASAVFDFINWQKETFSISKEDTVAQLTTPGFDVFYRDVLTPILANAQHVIPPKTHYYAEHSFLNWLKTEKVTILHMVPSIARLIVVNADLAKPNGLLRLTFFAGELLPMELVKDWLILFPNTRVINLYGPSETVLAKCYHEITTEDLERYNTSPVGKPFGLHQLQVVDESGQPKGLLEPGEVVFYPAHAISGYFNQFQLQQQPYYTGDIGYQDERGILHLLGRKDSVIKINGVKVDLAAMERYLAKAPGITQAVLVFDTERQRLCCFIATSETKASWGLFIKRLLIGLKAQLATDVLPNEFYHAEIFPLLSSGKVDRNSLILQRELYPLIYPALQNREALDIDEQVIDLWHKVLLVRPKGPDEDFYLAGGNSLKAIQLIVLVNKAFNTNLNLHDLADDFSLQNLWYCIQNYQEGLQQKQMVSRHSCKGLLDMNAERLQAIIDTIAPASYTPDACAVKRVFLTGATGYLGAYVLDKLLASAEVEQVYCVVRAQDEQEGLKRIQDNLAYYKLKHSTNQLKKVVVIPGDINKPLLGMSPGSYDEVTNRIGSICHIACYVDFLQPLEKLFDSNVASLQHIFALAKASQTRINYVSTVGIFPSSEAYEQKHFTETLESWFDEEDKIIGGYAQSKWLAEYICQKAIAKGYPINVYRPGRIFPSLEQYVSEPNDFILNFISSFAELGVAPDLKINIDLNPVDLVAASIFDGCVGLESGRVANIVNPNRIYIKDAIRLYKKMGIQVRLVSYEQWYDALQAAILQNKYCSMTPFFPLFERSIERLPRLRFNRYFITAEAEKSLGRQNYAFKAIADDVLVEVIKSFVSKKPTLHEAFYQVLTNNRG